MFLAQGYMWNPCNSHECHRISISEKKIWHFSDPKIPAHTPKQEKKVDTPPPTLSVRETVEWELGQLQSWDRAERKAENS